MVAHVCNSNEANTRIYVYVNGKGLNNCFRRFARVCIKLCKYETLIFYLFYKFE